MADYWKSQARYWCKYCKIYVTDNPISRQHHEQARKHKGNVERFLRETHTRIQKEKEENDYLAREMAKINQAAQSAYNLDLGRGNVSRDVTASTTTASKKRAASPVKSPIPSFVSKAEPRSSSSRNRANAAAYSQLNAAQLPFRLPEDDQVGAIGPWRRVEEPIMPTLQKENSTSASSSMTANKSKTQQIVGSSAANDLLLGDEEDEKTLGNDIDPNDPDDLRNFRVIEKSHPTEYDDDDDDTTTIYTKSVKKPLNEVKKRRKMTMMTTMIMAVPCLKSVKQHRQQVDHVIFVESNHNNKSVTV
ncbi:hypothetical protein BDF22DRAFT_635149 [Syncephalis plumigaleata]|nr:hypothetical protein BDF22DRAFT_635149 [Syncephalis plumigaleata]